MRRSLSLRIGRNGRHHPPGRSLGIAWVCVLGASLLICLFVGNASAQEPNPYSPQYEHPYRYGALPTKDALARMRAWRALHPAIATGPSTISYQGGYPDPNTSASTGIGVVSGVPQVYLVVWGTQWGTASTDGNGNMTLSNDPDGEVPFLQQMFKGIGTNGELWSGVATQYCDGLSPLVATGATSCPAGAAHIGYPTGGAFAGIWYDDSVPEPDPATQAQLAQEAVAAAAHFGTTSNRLAQYVILSATGTHPDGFNTVNGDFCGWHSSTFDATSSYVIAFSNEPYVPDLPAPGCNEDITGNPILDGISITASHEYAEVLTDFYPSYGWNNPADASTTGGESADQCQAATPNDALPVTTATGTFAMQLIWSNDTNQCEILHPVITGDTIFASSLE